MKRTTRRAAMAMMLVGTCGLGLAAQQTTQVHPGGGTPPSPHVKTAWVIDGANISIEYGRPSLRGRSDESLMPVGRPWRTGADEATVLTTDKPLRFGTLAVPAGSHTINTQPGATEWQLIIGKLNAPGQWGIPYNQALETGRAPMKLGAPAAPVETLTISIDDTASGGTLRVEWGSKSVTIPFTVG